MNLWDDGDDFEVGNSNKIKFQIRKKYQKIISRFKQNFFLLSFVKKKKLRKSTRNFMKSLDCVL